MGTVTSYLHYLLKSKTKHSVHSPFVYELCTTVFEDSTADEILALINKQHREHRLSSRVLETTDFGSFDTTRSYVTRFLKVSQIASNSVKKKEGELLFRLVSKLKPKHMLEMGTSLGISAMYLAKAAPEAQFYTIEGCAAKVEVAKANFLKLDCQNIEVKTGRFDTQLPKVLELMPKVDFAFIDGHSHFKSTLWYFQKLMPYFEDNSTVVIHQIHKNKGMEKAWISIQNMPSVTVTIDLYSLGIIFFNTSLSKQNFVIRF